MAYVGCQVARPFQSCKGLAMQTRQGLVWPSQTLADWVCERIRLGKDVSPEKLH